MSRPSLDGVDQRIARADEHLNLIEQIVAPLRAPNSYRLIGHFDAKAGEYVFRVEYAEFPPEVGIFVSEVAHHLRSALDNLAWELVRVRGGTPDRAEAVKFPIREKKPGGDSWQKAPLPGLTGEDRAVIDRAQPYHHGPHWCRRHLLSLLAHLNNIDKHRRLHVGFLAVAFTFPFGDERIRVPVHPGIEDLVQFLPPDGIKGAIVIDLLESLVRVRDCGDSLHIRFDSGRALDDPTEVVRIGLPEAGPHPEMKMEPEPPFEVSVTDSENPVTLADLRRIRNRVKELVDGFRSAFD